MLEVSLVCEVRKPYSGWIGRTVKFSFKVGGIRAFECLLEPLDGFSEQYDALAADVRKLNQKLKREEFVVHARVKFLERVRQIIFVDVPSEPTSAAYELGNTLGPGNRHWRRAKLFQRFRIFFRFSKADRIIIYAWINDERTLRTAGGRNDAYATFASLLRRGIPSPIGAS